jgi:hypothetical protein
VSRPATHRRPTAAKSTTMSKQMLVAIALAGVLGLGL